MEVVQYYLGESIINKKCFKYGYQNSYFYQPVFWFCEGLGFYSTETIFSDF